MENPDQSCIEFTLRFNPSTTVAHHQEMARLHLAMSRLHGDFAARILELMAGKTES